MARQITWYWLNTGDLPIFIKPRGEPAAIFRSQYPDAIHSPRNELAASEGLDVGLVEQGFISDPSVTVPTLYIESSRAFVHQWLLDKARAMISEVVTHNYYNQMTGVIRNSERPMRNPEEIQVEIGLILAPMPYLPAFQDRVGNPGVVREVSPSECFIWGLPMCDIDPPYEGPRPTRFERKYVI
jgi:hypothetical protein